MVVPLLSEPIQIHTIAYRLTRREVDGSVAEGEERPKGVNMTELADLLIEHGAVEGINLDGGLNQKTRVVGFTI